MIKQIFFILFLLLSLSVLPSCTIFGGDSLEEEDGVEEDYYPEEPVDLEGEGQGYADEEEPVQESDSLRDSGGEDREVVEYIDEEDEDMLEEGATLADGESEFADGSQEGLDESADLSHSDGVEDGNTQFFDSSRGSSSEKTKASPSPPVRKWISYKKIKNQPYNSAGFIINAVYIARAGDSIQSVSQKIFGSDQTDRLYAINPHLKVRALKTGDKIYYPSPNRPQDSSQLLFYFEDKGIPPQYHQVQAGENIRKVASALLGHKDSWKEIWATNLDMESKGTLDQALTVKYWPAGSDVQPKEPPAGTEEPSSVGGVEPEPPSSLEPASGDFSEEEESLPADPSSPQPPSVEENLEPLDSDPVVSEETDEAKVSSDKGFSQTDMAIAGLLALIAVIMGAVIFMRKWKKKTDFDYTAVNYEINK